MASDPDDETWLPLAEAAAHLGLSRSQLRRRIRAGQITSRQVPTPRGPAYEVLLDNINPSASVTASARQADGRHRGSSVTVTPPLAELVTLIRDLQAELVSKAEAAAMWQARAEYLAAQVEQLQKALPAPASTPRPLAGPTNAPASDPPEWASAPKRTWWSRAWRALTG